MLSRQFVYNGRDIDKDWQDRVLVLWEEDDARPADRERSNAALERITGIRPGTSPIHVINQGDQFVAFYTHGWVSGANCDGGWIGVLTEPSPVSPDNHTSKIRWFGPETAKTWQAGSRVLMRKTYRDQTLLTVSDYHRPDWVDAMSQRLAKTTWALLE